MKGKSCVAMMCVGVASELCAWHSAWILRRTVSLQRLSATSVAAWQKVQVVLMSNFPNIFLPLLSYCSCMCYVLGVRLTLQCDDCFSPIYI